MQLLKKKITLREVHAFSHQKCPKIESLSLDPYIPNEKNQALKLLAAVIDLVLSSISQLESTNIKCFLCSCKTYLEPCQLSMMGFCSYAVKYFRKKAQSCMFERVLNTPLPL